MATHDAPSTKLAHVLVPLTPRPGTSVGHVMRCAKRHVPVGDGDDSSSPCASHCVEALTSSERVCTDAVTVLVLVLTLLICAFKVVAVCCAMHACMLSETEVSEV